MAEPLQEQPARAPRAATDWLVNALLFLACAAAGFAYLNGFGIKPSVIYGDDTLTFLPAVGVAAGMGYASVDTDAPGVQAFLQQETDYLDLEPLRDPRFFRPVFGKFELDRVYLLYAVGWVWRWTGVSWHAAWVVPCLMLGLMSVAVYELFRLGAGRLLSLIATGMTIVSPLVLENLPGLRDFGKAPFILFAMLFCGLVLTGKLTGWRRAFACIAAGLLVGVGIGFRQDVIICLPPMLGCLLLEPRAVRWHVRLAGILLVLAAFLPPAWPVLRMNADTGGNNAFYLVQGFSEYSMRDLNLKPAAYTPVYSHVDQGTHAAIVSYAEAEGLTLPQELKPAWTAARVRAALLAPILPWHPAVVLPAAVPADRHDIWSYGSEQVARRMFQDLCVTFPADVLMRAYGSVLRIVRGERSLYTRDVPDRRAYEAVAAVRDPVDAVLRYLALPLAVLVILCYAARRPWQALLALGVALYFLGYPSLSSQQRHVFHLGFVSLWPLAVVLSHTLHRDRLRALPRNPTEWWNVTQFSVVVAACLLLPWLGAYAWQRAQVEFLLERYDAAELETLSYSEETLEGGNCYVPEAGSLFEDLNASSPWSNFLSGRTQTRVAAEYLVADLECVSPGTRVDIEYDETVVELGDWTERHYPDEVLPLRVRVFVPVFQFAADERDQTGESMPPFHGLTVDGENRLVALHRVRNIEGFPLLMNLWLPEDRSLLRHAYGPRWWPS